MSVDLAAANLIAARLGKVGPAQSRQQRPDEKHRAAQSGAAANVVAAHNELLVDIGRAKRIASRAATGNMNANANQQVNQVIDVENLGNIVDFHFGARQQRGRNYLERLILGAHRGY